ncbi:MAG: Crp/Fnr family transcriptional regulator [Sphingobacteriales bacterium]|nr:MAG: Crp/Fnr family transcriptional regulator [Sphingobacteriales bacterium]
MHTEQHLSNYRLKLQQCGALRPEAWEQCVPLLKVLRIGINNSCMVPRGSIAYVAEGLLKEYDTKHRKSPSIVNFLAPGQFFYSYASANRIYIKATAPCTIILLGRKEIRSLVLAFDELDSLFLALCTQYDELRLLKIQLLEYPVAERIETFRSNFKAIIPYLKKKDIANYLHLNYTHFLKNWNSY